MDQTVLLSVRVLRINLDPNGPWRQGLFKELFSTVTASKNRPPQQEKWCVSVAQAPPGPPPSGGEFREVFRSEVLEDPPAGSVCPSLVATVRCPPHVDSALRVRVHYSSKGWTGGKEVVLCEATFVSSSDVVAKRGAHAPLASPYLKTPATLELTVMAPLRPVLEHRAFGPRAPPNEQNPLLQSYVFYRDDEYAVPPPVFVQEHALECRISGRVPEAFLEAVLAALERSKAAWVGHGNLEAHRIRSADRGVLSASDIGVEVGVDGCPPHVTARREWEWLVGMNGVDPLAGPTDAAASSSSSSSPPSTSSSSAQLAMEVDLLNFDDNDAAGPKVSGDDIIKRHCRYSVPAVAAYVAQLDELADEVREAVRNVRTLLDAGKTFRASATKKHSNVQALPVNLHMQVLAVRDLIKDGQESVLDALSCGCLSPHALGFADKKGLDAMDAGLAAASKKLDGHKRRLVELAGNTPSTQHLSPQPLSAQQLAFVPVGTAADAPAPGVGGRTTSPTPVDPVAALAADVCARAQDCDLQVLAAGRRRIFAMSQSLAVAVAAVLMKLTLVAEGKIPAAAALDWLTNGFLLVFEGLLSVIGTERFMLEDTVAAIDALNHYSVRVLPAAPASPPAAEADVAVRGREVLLFLPPDALRALPWEYARDGGAVLQLTSVLFSQGIDLHQSLALAASSITAIASQAQANINSNHNNNGNTGAGLVKSPSKETFGGASSGSAAAGKEGANSPVTSNMVATATAAGDDTGVGNDTSGLEESAAMQSFQHAINVRALVRLLEHCQQVGGDAAAAADDLYGGAVAAKESIDRYRSSTLQTASPKNHARKHPALGSRHGGDGGGGGGGSSGSHATAGTGSITGTSSTGSSSGGGSGSGGGGSGSTLNKAVKASKLAMAMTSVASSALRSYGARLMQKGSGGADGADAEYAVTGAETGDAPLVEALGDLSETILTRGNVISKNVDLLVAAERVCVALGGCRVTFCKSGKDRTGMAVTYEQSRRLGERFHCGSSLQRAIRDANVMRVHGVRIDVAEKNIGRRVYSINALQAHFLPAVYRPPPEVLETMMRKDDT